MKCFHRNVKQYCAFSVITYDVELTSNSEITSKPIVIDISMHYTLQGTRCVGHAKMQVVPESLSSTPSYYSLERSDAEAPESISLSLSFKGATPMDQRPKNFNILKMMRKGILNPFNLPIEKTDGFGKDILVKYLLLKRSTRIKPMP